MRISDWSSDVCSSDLGRRVLDVQGGQDQLTRVAALTQRELAANSIGVDLDRGNVHLGGVISLPTYNRGIADHQYLFVNGRPVKDRLLVGALRGAYADLQIGRASSRARVCQYV